MFTLRLGILLTFLLMSSYACRQNSAVNDTKTASNNQIPVREYSIQSVLWQQLSSEYKALCYQAFKLAKFNLDEVLATTALKEQKNLAIITDIDETVLNNSPFNAKLIQDKQEYTKQRWIEWGQLEQAAAVPGALDFLNYAASKGVDVYYISNRYDTQLQATMRNLKKAGFPFVDEAHILLRSKTRGKEERRQKVISHGKSVIMLLGDNLSDFSEAFEGKSTKERNSITDKFQEEFGAKFIVLPNPMYGDWENRGVYEGKNNWTVTQKDSIRKAKLIAY